MNALVLHSTIEPRRPNFGRFSRLRVGDSFSSPFHALNLCPNSGVLPLFDALHADQIGKVCLI